VWAGRIERGRKGKIVWTIDDGRWKEELYARLK
jgi:hypothetical protein